MRIPIRLVVVVGLGLAALLLLAWRLDVARQEADGLRAKCDELSAARYRAEHLRQRLLHGIAIVERQIAADGVLHMQGSDGLIHWSLVRGDGSTSEGVIRDLETLLGQAGAAP